MISDNFRRSSHLGRPAGDVKCADGFVDYGWRKVNKRGEVKFNKSTFKHDELVKFIGEWVMIESDDCWGIDASFRPFGLSGIGISLEAIK